MHKAAFSVIPGGLVGRYQVPSKEIDQTSVDCSRMLTIHQNRPIYCDCSRTTLFKYYLDLISFEQSRWEKDSRAHWILDPRVLPKLVTSCHMTLGFHSVDWCYST
ncbi:hypothetical protein OUZ56_006548 [Daphnia magna]|uniref:Uncharacterized protein n=1 Tax=Daphnia magna TaxID=35525 RepID=A0ABQ9YXB3_9CRUS|nr:hypothetical protein OUZ56_006548 [Daphnia magna]